MPLTDSQITELKSQLKAQTQDLPPDKKAEAEKQIDSMTPEALELMLQQQQSQTPKIYRQIVKGEIPAVKAGESKTSLAVLDNKPISKGHIVIIPKKPAKTPKKIPKSSFRLAEELSKKITENLKENSQKEHSINW